jgi:hypothetical protein
VVAIPQVGDYTTDISDAPPNRSKPVAPMFALLSFTLIYATKLLLIKIGFFREANARHLDARDDWTSQKLPVFRVLRCACRQGKCMTRSAISVPLGCWFDTDEILGRHSFTLPICV